MEASQALNAHAKPPVAIRDVYKRFQKIGAGDLAAAGDIIDSSLPENDTRLSSVEPSSFAQLPNGIREIFENFAGPSGSPSLHSAVYALKEIPGTYHRLVQQ